MDFKGKVAVVTGGGSGIGRACVEEFSKRRARVALVDRDRNSALQTISELRQEEKAAVAFFSCDISVRTQVAELIPEIAKKMGRIDILVNNAGIQRYGTATSTTEELWDEVMAVNLKGAFLMSKYAIPEMIKVGGGAIAITGSVQSMTAVANSAAYVVSKHAVLGLARSIALDFAKHNIRVNCVCPGAIDTPMLRWSVSLDKDPAKSIQDCHRMHALGRMGKPEEAARVIAFLCSDLASFVTGDAVLVDGGMLVPAGGTAFQETGPGGE